MEEDARNDTPQKTKKDFRRTKAYRALKNSLDENMLSRGLVEDVYIDKMQEYLDLWVMRQELREDVRKRGVAVLDEKRGTMMENRSISLIIQISKQLLLIYKALGFEQQTTQGRAGDEDDEL